MSKDMRFKGTIYEKGYGFIAKVVMIDTKISIGAKALYSYICAYAGNDGCAFPSRDRILNELNIGKDTFTKYKRELMENGYLKVEQMRVGGKFKSNIYNVERFPGKAGKIEESLSATLLDTVEPCMNSSATTEEYSTNNSLFTNNKINTKNNNNNNILSPLGKKEDEVSKEEKKSDDIPYSRIIDYLNKMTGKKYRSSIKKTKDLIKARFNDGFTEEDFLKVINIKVAAWKGNEMDMYLRPSTLFGTKFEEYLNENPNAKKKEQKQIVWYKKKSSFCDFKQRAYDGTNGEPTMEELERMLLGWSD